MDTETNLCEIVALFKDNYITEADCTGTAGCLISCNSDLINGFVVQKHATQAHTHTHKEKRKPI